MQVSTYIGWVLMIDFSIQSIFLIIEISNLLILSVPGEGYFRNAWCAVNYISTFLLLSVGRYLCWWTIISRGYVQ